MNDGNADMQSVEFRNQDNAESDGWFLDDRVKRLLLELQRRWLESYQTDREKVLVEVTKKLHDEFMTEQQQTKADLLAQFKEELENTRVQLDRKHQEALEVELQRVSERFQREVQACKRKQWCHQCENEAIYHCCWNCAYCSTECQQRHWPAHRKNCRRRAARN